MEDLKNIPTSRLVEELGSREGVVSQMIDVNEALAIMVDGKQISFSSVFGFDVETGPAIVLVVID